MAFEAMNSAGIADCDLLVILHDNDMSISPAVGAMNRYLARLVSGRVYVAARRAAERLLAKIPSLRALARRLEVHAKGMLLPSTLFEQFGFNSIGPIDGHDLDSLIPPPGNIRELQGLQFPHIVTREGQGYKLAEADPVLLPPRCGLCGGPMRTHAVVIEALAQYLSSL
jgi:1-deoxy-D-xylulose-5-phosphate synthase